MHRDTGEIRPIPEGERPTPDEVELTAAEAAEALQLPAAMRMAWWARNERGKDRTQSRTKPKSDNARRMERRAHRNARKGA